MRLNLLVLFCALAFIGYSQKKAAPAPIVKKPLDHSVYDGWKEIPYRALAPDGNYAALLVNPQEGDGKGVFYNIKTGAQDSVKRAAEVALTYSSEHAVFKIKPPYKLVKDLRRQKKKKEDLPKDSLGIYAFKTRQTVRVPEVKSFKIPEKAGGWVAYQLEAKKDVKPKADPNAKPEEKKTATKKKKANTDDNGYTLVLRELGTGKETLFGYVKDYTFAKFGQGLLFSSTGNDSTQKAGLYWYDLAARQLQTLHEGKPKFKYKGLSISEDGLQCSFLVDTDTTKALVRNFKLFYWKKGTATAAEFEVKSSLGIPPNWLVSEHYTPLFSKDGSKLFFGAAPVPVVADTTLLPEEIVNVEVWTSQDEQIYPQQNRQLENEKKRSYLQMIDLSGEARRIWNLATADVPEVVLGDEGNADVVLAKTDRPYRRNYNWDPMPRQDVYVVDMKNNVRKSIAKGLTGNALLSPKANFVYWFSPPDTTWFSHSLASDKTTKHKLPFLLADEEDDHPDYPNAYGAAGWTEGDAQFLVYDRYDIWALDPTGQSAPRNLTQVGRKEKIQFRYLRLDAEQRFIDSKQDLLLSAFNELTKQAGYYKLNLASGALTRILLTDHRYTFTAKAKLASQFLFTRESFREFPDVWTTDASFVNPKRITEANPQMKNYLWGTVEMVNWTSLDNIPLKGLLYKPENFDPKKKYPLMVYFYEKYADDIHAHYAPRPIRSYINFSLYASDGYLIFVPDIVYKVGYPGESAHNCILPGVTSLIAKGFVDEKRIGISGHSWGGYQTAYLVTRTNMFRAAEAGAPVSNMTSAYGGIRWESGLSRMFQYEKDQSRLGGSLWQTPLRYIENSPLFFADKIETPVLMMHNDADGAVPWYQGIEMYMALRRLNKPVWMLNYNGQGHGLSQRQDMRDFAIRMKQYFDHYLKDAPQPPWMQKGVPATEKSITTGY
jgi:dipeptidyl aminopeptidase/acylaminoacyl peptidase